MNATKSRSEVMGTPGGGGGIPSRWNDSLRSAVSTRCATTSLTRQAPATVGRCQSSGGNPRSSVTRLPDTGRNIARVSTVAGGSSGMKNPIPLAWPRSLPGGLHQQRDPAGPRPDVHPPHAETSVRLVNVRLHGRGNSREHEAPAAADAPNERRRHLDERRGQDVEI